LCYTASGIVTLCRWPSGDQEVKFDYTASGIVTLCRWPSGAPEGHLQSVTIPDAV